MAENTGATAPMRLHHAARVVRDQESNRKLIEDVLGIPLVATWCENFPHPEMPGTEMELCHTFFRLGDGSALAFFQFGNAADYEKYAPKLGTLTGMFDHTALKVTADGYADLLGRVKEAKAQFLEVDHGYCRSLYVPSDQGFTLEFACDPANVGEIEKLMEKTAHADLRRWLAGDHHANNAPPVVSHG
jgi:glyoxylase I family protein